MALLLSRFRASQPQGGTSVLGVFAVHRLTVRFAGWLARPPMPTTTGSVPLPAPEGTVKLICKTPTDSTLRPGSLPPNKSD